MATISDYLDWRGDVPFSVAPVNELDEYILCKIGMLDFTGIVPGDGTFVPLSAALERYFSSGGPTRLGLIASKRVVPTVQRLPQTERFGALTLSLWRSHTSSEQNEQFAALTVRLPDGRPYITFRGTDDTIVGWKEDLLLTVMDAVPAQRDAAAYLAESAALFPGELRLAGHSKGGNLAVYAAAAAAPAVRERIVSVVNFDGPGFLPEFLETPGYLAVRDRVRVIIARQTMVGSLMFRDTLPEIAESRSFLGGSHDGFAWSVEAPDHFLRAAELSPTSRIFDKTMKDVLLGLTVEERRAFIDDFFGILASTGAQTLSDLTERRLRETLATARTLSREPGVHRLVSDTLEGLVREALSERSAALPRLKLPGTFRRRQNPGAGEK